MKEIFFGHMTFLNKQTNKYEVILTGLTDTIEKTAYLLYLNNTEDKDDVYSSFCYRKIPDELYDLFMNKNGLMPVFRSRDIDEYIFSFYDPLPFVFHELYTDKKSLLIKSLNYLKDLNFNKETLEEMNSIIDHNWIKLIKKSEDDFSGLHSFLAHGNLDEYDIIEDYQEMIKYTSLYEKISIEEERLNEKDNFILLSEKPKYKLPSLDEYETYEDSKKYFFKHYKDKYYKLGIFFEKLYEKNNLSITITTNDNYSKTFLESNKQDIFNSLNSNLSNKSIDRIEIIIRQETNLLLNNSKKKFTRIAAAVFKDNDFILIPKEEFKENFSLNFNTNEQLPKEEVLIFYDFKKLLSTINIII